MKTVAILILLAAGCGSVDARRIPDGGIGGAAGESEIGAGGSGSAGGAAGADSSPDASVDTGVDAQRAPNLITSEAGSWVFTPPADGTATTAVKDGTYCTTMTGTGTAVATTGWPAMVAQSVPLPVGATFEFSYQGSTTASLWTFMAKVGSVVSPYAEDFQVSDVLADSLQTFTHTFTAAGDGAAGIAFTFSANATAPVTVCVGDVMLRRI